MLGFSCSHANTLFRRTTEFGIVTLRGRGVFSEVSHAIAFAEMRRAVCQRQLSFLFLCVGYSNQVKYSTIRSLREIDVLVQKSTV